MTCWENKYIWKTINDLPFLSLCTLVVGQDQLTGSRRKQTLFFMLLIVSLHVVQGESTWSCDNETDSVATLPNIYFCQMSLYLKIAINNLQNKCFNLYFNETKTSYLNPLLVYISMQVLFLIPGTLTDITHSLPGYHPLIAWLLPTHCLVIACSLSTKCPNSFCRVEVQNLWGK
jgi:hypothetical protein